MKSGIWKKVFIIEIVLFIALSGFMYTGNTFSRDEVDVKVDESFQEYVGAECDFQLTEEGDGIFLYEGTVESGEMITAAVEYRKLFGSYNITKLTYEMSDGEGSAEVSRTDVMDFLMNMILIVAAGDVVAWFIISWRNGTLGDQKVFGRRKK